LEKDTIILEEAIIILEKDAIILGDDFGLYPPTIDRKIMVKSH
jgi:hypothetical protein